MKYIFILLFFIPSLGYTRSYLEKIHISGDMELIKISDSVYVHVSYSESESYGRFSSNGMIFISSGQALLFDTPVSDSITKSLVDFIQDSLNAKVIGFVPNHWHDDCMGGLNSLHSIGIASYANVRTIQIAKSKHLPVPQYGFQDSLILRVGCQSAACYYFGAAHSTDNIVVWLPSEKILFGGCMVKAIESKGLGNTADGDAGAWPVTIDKVMKKFRDARYVIPGHGTAGGTELLTHTKSLLENKK